MKNKINKFHPFVQAGAILVVLIPVLSFVSLQIKDPDVIWQVAATGLLLFAAGNPILGIFKKNWLKYLIFSLIAFVILLFAIYGMTDYLAARNLSELSHMKMLFISVIVFYLMITFLVLIYRNIVSILGKME